MFYMIFREEETSIIYSEPRVNLQEVGRVLCEEVHPQSKDFAVSGLVGSNSGMWHGLSDSYSSSAYRKGIWSTFSLSLSLLIKFEPVNQNDIVLFLSSLHSLACNFTEDILEFFLSLFEQEGNFINKDFLLFVLSGSSTSKQPGCQRWSSQHATKVTRMKGKARF